MLWDRSVWGCFKTYMFAVFQSHGYFSDFDWIRSFVPAMQVHFFELFILFGVSGLHPFSCQHFAHPLDIRTKYSPILCDCLKFTQEKICFFTAFISSRCPMSKLFPWKMLGTSKMILLFMMLVYSFFFNLLVSYFGQDLPMCFFFGWLCLLDSQGKDVCLGLPWIKPQDNIMDRNKLIHSQRYVFYDVPPLLGAGDSPSWLLQHMFRDFHLGKMNLLFSLM